MFFVPDVSMLAYLGGKQLGAIVYNTFHSYGLPILGGFLLWYMSWTDLTYILLIWVAHIGFDRALGYGLKYREGFNYTHLGRIGKRPLGKEDSYGRQKEKMTSWGQI